METELISVIVPVYNVERYLRRCVDSILHQTYRNLEVLLVDDGSTDASGAICDEYAAQEERVTAVHQKNGGLSAARNAGLERAQGTYLCFVDSDDFLNSRMLETLCRDLQEQDADVAVVGFRMFEREEELAPAELTVPVQCMTGREAIRSTLVSDELGDFAWNKLYKRELFRDIRYPLGRMMEDQGTTYRIFQQCSVVYEGWVADAKLQDGLLACIRQRHKTEPLFMTLVYLAAHVFGDVHWLYFMVDLLACGLFMIGLVQYKEYVSVPYGWLAYLCLYYGDTYNAERQSVALGVAFLAFSFAWKKKYHWAVLLLAVSCLFHNATFISFGALLIYILLQHFDNWWVKGGLAAFSVYLAFFSKAVVRLALNVDFIDRLYGYYYDANAGGFTLNPIIVRLPFLILPIVLYRWYAKEEGEGRRRFTRSDADFWIVMILIEMATAQLRNINVPLYRICLYFAFFRYLAIGRVVKCVEDERLRKLLKAAMWGMLVIIWIYQAYIQGNNAICPYTSEILHIGRETFF